MTTYDKTINVNVPEGVTNVNLGINISINSGANPSGCFPKET